MRVQATKQGFYDQVLREPGEVFDLSDDANGEMPLRMDRVYELDAKTGKPTGEFTETVYLDKEGNPMHADFAPDHEEITGKGAFRGETFTPGWMISVPEETEVGIYEPDVRFSAQGREVPKPVQRIIKASNEPANMPRMTPMKGKAQRQRRSA
jgi:hypothetical protein